MSAVIELRTLEDRLIAEVQDPVVAMMEANGRAPEVLVWGERVFVLQSPDAYRRGVIRYREGMAWPLRLGDDKIEIPLHTVDGLPAGKTMLPISTGAPDPRAETAGSDKEDHEKMTESSQVSESEPVACSRPCTSADPEHWAAEFMRRFGGGLRSASEIHEVLMAGWFGGAMSAARNAGNEDAARMSPDREYGIGHIGSGLIHRGGMTKEQALLWMDLARWEGKDPSRFQVVSRPVGMWSA